MNDLLVWYFGNMLRNNIIVTVNKNVAIIHSLVNLQNNAFCLFRRMIEGVSNQRGCFLGAIFFRAAIIIDI